MTADTWLLVPNHHLLGDHGVLKGTSADEAFERHVLLIAAHLVVFVIVDTVAAFVQLPFDLPAVFVVRAVVQELAAV